MTDTEIPEGMKPWHGGDGPPADWDGGPVLLKDPVGVVDAPRRPEQWQGFHSTYRCVIAYTPKPPAYPEGMTPELWGQVLECLTAVSQMSGTKQADKARAIMAELPEPVDALEETMLDAFNFKPSTNGLARFRASLGKRGLVITEATP